MSIRQKSYKTKSAQTIFTWIKVQSRTSRENRKNADPVKFNNWFPIRSTRFQESAYVQELRRREATADQPLFGARSVDIQGSASIRIPLFQRQWTKRIIINKVRPGTARTSFQWICLWKADAVRGTTAILFVHVGKMYNTGIQDTVYYYGGARKILGIDNHN